MEVPTGVGVNRSAPKSKTLWLTRHGCLPALPRPVNQYNRTVLKRFPEWLHCQPGELDALQPLWLLAGLYCGSVAEHLHYRRFVIGLFILWQNLGEVF